MPRARRILAVVTKGFPPSAAFTLMKVVEVALPRQEPCPRHYAQPAGEAKLSAGGAGAASVAAIAGRACAAHFGAYTLDRPDRHHLAWYCRPCRQVSAAKLWSSLRTSLANLPNSLSLGNGPRFGSPDAVFSTPRALRQPARL